MTSLTSNSTKKYLLKAFLFVFLFGLFETVLADDKPSSYTKITYSNGYFTSVLPYGKEFVITGSPHILNSKASTVRLKIYDTGHYSRRWNKKQENYKENPSIDTTEIYYTTKWISTKDSDAEFELFISKPLRFNTQYKFVFEYGIEDELSIKEKEELKDRVYSQMELFVMSKMDNAGNLTKRLTNDSIIKQVEKTFDSYVKVLNMKRGYTSGDVSNNITFLIADIKNSMGAFDANFISRNYVELVNGKIILIKYIIDSTNTKNNLISTNKNISSKEEKIRLLLTNFNTNHSKLKQELSEADSIVNTYKVQIGKKEEDLISIESILNNLKEDELVKRKIYEKRFINTKTEIIELEVKLKDIEEIEVVIIKADIVKLESKKINIDSEIKKLKKDLQLMTTERKNYETELTDINPELNSRRSEILKNRENIDTFFDKKYFDIKITYTDASFGTATIDIADIQSISFGSVIGGGVLLLNPGIKSEPVGFGYFGIKYYFLARDKRVANPYLEKPEILNRLSLLIGFAVGSFSYKGESLVNIAGVHPMLGLSFDINRFFSIDAGSLWFMQNSINTYNPQKKLRMAPFVTLSFDMDLFNRFKAAIAGDEYKE